MSATPDLLSVALKLRPLSLAPAAGGQPRWWGRAAHSLLLQIIAAADPALAESLHSESALRPFSVSTLLGRFPHGELDLAGVYTLRLTALSAPVAAALLQAIHHGPLAPGGRIELDYLPFEVLAAARDPSDSPWAATSAYTSLGAPWLLARQTAPRRLALQFTSPTSFKTSGKFTPFPLPELVFGSLLERWNAFAPIQFPAEARRYAQECLGVARFHLDTRSAPSKGLGLRIGFIGQASFTSLNYDRYWMAVIAALADFALFSGVGAGISFGLGQCRRVEERNSPIQGGETSAPPPAEN